MQQIARAWNVQSYRKSVESLKKIKLYNGNPNVTEYCEKVWLNCSEHWLQTFRIQQAVNIVNTNNGIEPQKKVFKFSYLPSSLESSVFGSSVFGIAVLIVESLVLQSYQHYCDLKLQISS